MFLSKPSITIHDHPWFFLIKINTSWCHFASLHHPLSGNIPNVPQLKTCGDFVGDFRVLQRAQSSGTTKNGARLGISHLLGNLTGYILRYCSIPRKRWDIDGNIYIWHMNGIYIWNINGILMAGWWLSPIPLKNDGVKVSWDDDIPDTWKNEKWSKPPTSANQV